MLMIDRNTNRKKLLTIFIDPWKDFDSESPFDMSESIFEVYSNVNIPKYDGTPCMSIG